MKFEEKVGKFSGNFWEIFQEIFQEIFGRYFEGEIGYNNTGIIRHVAEVFIGYRNGRSGRVRTVTRPPI